MNTDVLLMIADTNNKMNPVKIEAEIKKNKTEQMDIKLGVSYHLKLKAVGAVNILNVSQMMTWEMMAASEYFRNIPVFRKIIAVIIAKVYSPAKPEVNFDSEKESLCFELDKEDGFGLKWKYDGFVRDFFVEKGSITIPCEGYETVKVWDGIGLDFSLKIRFFPSHHKKTDIDEVIADFADWQKVIYDVVRDTESDMN